MRLPITAPILEGLRSALDGSSHPQKIPLWAVACVAFFGFFRLGELLPESTTAYVPSTSLSWGDVAVDSQDNPTMVRIHLKRDQFGAGTDVILGRTHNPLCPVAAILNFMAVRQASPGPFFVETGGRTITKSWFVGEIRIILTSLGLPQHQYAGHSFCIGAATSAALAGIEDSTIQTLGRWHSAAYLQYIRMPREQLAALSNTLSALAFRGISS